MQTSLEEQVREVLGGAEGWLSSMDVAAQIFQQEGLSTKERSRQRSQVYHYLEKFTKHGLAEGRDSWNEATGTRRMTYRLRQEAPT